MKDLIVKRSPKYIIIKSLKIMGMLLVVEVVDYFTNSTLKPDIIDWYIILILPLIFFVFSILSYYFSNRVNELVFSNGTLCFKVKKSKGKGCNVQKIAVENCKVEMKCFIVDVTCFFLKVIFVDQSTNQIIATIIPFKDGFNKSDLVYLLKIACLIPKEVWVVNNRIRKKMYIDL